jgi:hypothetical protein
MDQFNAKVDEFETDLAPFSALFGGDAASLIQALRDRKTLCYISDDPNIIAGFRSFARKIGGEFRIEHVGPLTKLMIIPPRSGLGRD